MLLPLRSALACAIPSLLHRRVHSSTTHPSFSHIRWSLPLHIPLSITLPPLPIELSVALALTISVLPLSSALILSLPIPVQLTIPLIVLFD